MFFRDDAGDPDAEVDANPLSRDRAPEATENQMLFASLTLSNANSGRQKLKVAKSAFAGAHETLRLDEAFHVGDDLAGARLSEEQLAPVDGHSHDPASSRPEDLPRLEQTSS